MGQFGHRTCIEGKRVHLPSLGPMGLREAGGVNNTRSISHFYACLRACPNVHVQLHTHTNRVARKGAYRWPFGSSHSSAHFVLRLGF